MKPLKRNTLASWAHLVGALKMYLIVTSNTSRPIKGKIRNAITFPDQSLIASITLRAAASFLICPPRLTILLQFCGWVDHTRRDGRYVHSAGVLTAITARRAGDS